ncbi:MAG: ATP-binding protein [Planctomycetaceae bacterium]
MTPVLVGWSGGKDCALALHDLLTNPKLDVVGIVTTFTRPYDRVSMHGVQRELIQAQAAQLALPLVESWIQAGASNAEYEAAFKSSLQPWIDRGVTTIAWGDLFLSEIRAYRERMAAEIGLTGHFPIWGRRTDELSREFLQRGFRARLCCLDERKLDPGLCGCEFDADLLAQLGPGVDPCGENGEFHTFVWDAPAFAAPISIQAGAERRDSPFVFRDLALTTPEPSSFNQIQECTT